MTTTSLPFTDESPAIIIDRSTLEQNANCPHAAWHIRHGTVTNSSEFTAIGDEVHRILSGAVGMRFNDALSAKDLRDFIEAEAMKSRPDIQPQVIAAVRWASWKISNLLTMREDGQERHPDDIIAYDGGEMIEGHDSGQSGQLAAVLMPATDDRPEVQITAELDLLMATASAAELDSYDWKSGWRHWTATDVAESFQFQQHAWLCFHRFPKLQRLNVRVVMTRMNSITSPVAFDRDECMFTIGKRLQSAAELYLQHHDAKDASTVPAWPLPAKCGICPAVTKCVAAHKPEWEVAADPETYLKRYAAAQAAADSMKTALTAFVRNRGADLTVDGIAFGSEKPKARRAPTMDLYELKGDQ